MAAFVKVTQRTVQAWRNQGPPKDEMQQLRAERRKLTDNQELDVIVLIEKQTGLFLRQVADQVYASHGVKI